jgi:NADPH:quinone reductase-like Zn-dependent oxidoreductase
VFAMLGLVGAYAQYVVVKPALAARKPKSIDHVHAASIPLAALTAWQALFDKAQVEAGQRVLVQAAAGGVGSFAVQLARWKGAHVSGTASAANTEYVKSLGAERVIDYHTEKFEESLRDMDVVIDLLGREVSERSVAVLKHGGVLVSVVPASAKAAELAQAAAVSAVRIQVQPNGTQLARIAELVDAGQLQTSIAGVFPLSQAAQAQELSKRGHTRGKIVITAIEA